MDLAVFESRLMAGIRRPKPQEVTGSQRVICAVTCDLYLRKI
jgi:hypothetical protein